MIESCVSVNRVPLFDITSINTASACRVAVTEAYFSYWKRGKRGKIPKICE
jgi:hypothetical protein